MKRRRPKPRLALVPVPPWRGYSYDLIRLILGEQVPGIPDIVEVVTRAVREAALRTTQALESRLRGVDRSAPDLPKIVPQAYADQVLAAEEVIYKHRGRIELAPANVRVETIVLAKKASRNLARREVVETHSRTMQSQVQTLGVERFVWVSSRDERVRKRHVDLDGTVHRYDDPPIADLRTGARYLPGTSQNCRCTASPLLDDILAALDK